MRINVLKTPKEMGRAAAKFIAEKLNEAIAARGKARFLVSTGASQFEMFDALVHEKVDWRCVTMFHLDEYIGLPSSHKASFRKYLKERFADRVNLGEAVYVQGDGELSEVIATLTKRVSEAPMDVAAIGIGENAHVAFNDPPADFHTQESYIVVSLDENCKKQQVGEGWFPTLDDVPTRAISMSVSQILKAKCIVSVVPHGVKAEAIKNTLLQKESPLVPATVLKNHEDWNLYLDAESAKGFLTW